MVAEDQSYSKPYYMIQYYEGEMIQYYGGEGLKCFILLRGESLERFRDRCLDLNIMPVSSHC